MGRVFSTHDPRLDQHPYSLTFGSLSLSYDVLEARLYFSLHLVIVSYLEWWGISPSQMAPNPWCYLVVVVNRDPHLLRSGGSKEPAIGGNLISAVLKPLKGPKGPVSPSGQGEKRPRSMVD
ncbi:hypothetical protein GW17_00029336 [Ensete ventricosum]|nr:hypothetical protein GW17_00029336 [Ensete ventricosum]